MDNNLPENNQQLENMKVADLLKCINILISNTHYLQEQSPSKFQNANIAKLKVKKNKKNRTRFAKQQYKMYLRLENYVRSTKILYIERQNLIDILKIKNCLLDVALCRLRKQYKEIYNTQFDLIRYDTDSKLYIIHNAWK